MIDWKVGDKIKCVDANPFKYHEMLPQDRLYSDDMDGLKVGSVYTIRSIETARVGSMIPGDSQEVDLIGVKVKEIYRKITDLPFGFSRFELHERV